MEGVEFLALLATGVGGLVAYIYQQYTATLADRRQSELNRVASQLVKSYSVCQKFHLLPSFSLCSSPVFFECRSASHRRLTRSGRVLWTYVISNKLHVADL